MIRRLVPYPLPLVLMLSLIGLPVLLAAGLSLRALESDTAVVLARRNEAAELRLTPAAERLSAVVETLTAEALRRADESIRSENLADPIPNRMRGAPGSLTILYDDDRRVFPPEDSTGVLAFEVHRLSLLSGTVRAARQRLAAAPRAWQWLSGQPDGLMLLTCGRTPPRQDLCVTLDGADVAPVLTAKLHDLTAESPAWALSLIGPDGVVVTPAGTAAIAGPASIAAVITERNLDGALAGWRLRIAALPGAGMTPAWPRYLLVAVPVLALAGLALWYGLERRRAFPSDHRQETPETTAFGATSTPPAPATPAEPAIVAETSHRFRMDDLDIDPKTLRAYRGETAFNLTQRELTLLSVLHARKGEVLTRDELFDLVWGRDYMPNSRALDQHVSVLRRKIERDPARPRIVRTVHGVGYRYEDG